MKVKQGEEIFYLSKGTTHMLQGKFEVLGELKGKEMEGWTYDGPFDELPAENQVGRQHRPARTRARTSKHPPNEAHRVILWDEVGEDEGTGIVHIAPGCGAEDYQAGQAELGCRSSRR